ncbi:MAG: bifunctional 5,10-methylene-tetrahydrofolate dehydrogenase/5,10-methylene-tetrahydrofolate cyclohydrolase [Planctomycetota bacterium]|nr:MAG: bifunctional 5,10-methylene-tetrahydrofolate dehydrogenase/5,10-methylene-tetrahydrofolate cyclohydrolase [Planctomycetota bacterium]
MAAALLDGKALAARIQAEIAEEVRAFTAQMHVTPCLAAVLVGENPASEVYVRNKRLASERVGMTSRLIRMDSQTSQHKLLALVAQLNADTAVHGILIQLPLPKQIDSHAVLCAVSPLKDVDAFHPENVGLLVQGTPRFAPCTPYGVQQLLIRSGIETAGRHAVVLGRSDIVGKPMANLLVQRGPGGDATVTICHSKTRDLAAITRQADILIAAIGQAQFVKADMVKPGAAVVDVGMNRLDSGKLVGDVDFDAVKEVAGHITPVPGGVGPLTVTMLLKNTLSAAILSAVKRDLLNTD